MPVRQSIDKEVILQIVIHFSNANPVYPVDKVCNLNGIFSDLFELTDNAVYM